MFQILKYSNVFVLEHILYVVIQGKAINVGGKKVVTQLLGESSSAFLFRAPGLFTKDSRKGI